MTPGSEIGLRIDQTLTQDATGTLVMLELEAMELDRVRTELSAQYVDHNLLQTDERNADDHLFLYSACRRFGIWYSKPGNGVSHPVGCRSVTVGACERLSRDAEALHVASPGNVVPVREVAGADIYQVVVGSSANPSLRDFGSVAKIVEGKQTHPRVSFDVNPTSRQTLEALVSNGLLAPLIHAGARLHQSGCMGCIGMGQAPATGQISLRTMPRNFPGRSGTREDLVYLCSPETAAASALTGKITDPRDLVKLYDMTYPAFTVPDEQKVNTEMLVAPSDSGEEVELVKGPNISTLPDFDPLPNDTDIEVLLKVGDDVSTDEIMPAGQRVLPFRSNIPKIAEFTFTQIDDSCPERARAAGSGHAVIGGSNYGQGSSREHAAIAPRYLGLRVVIAKNFARIHWQNLINYGILPLEFTDESDYDSVQQGDILALRDLRAILGDDSSAVGVENTTRSEHYALHHRLSKRQVEMVLIGGLIPVFRQRLAAR